MEEKIHIERPRPFSSGYIIPFYKDKKPLIYSVATTRVEYLADQRRLALHIPDTTPERVALDALDRWALSTLIQKNAQWFPNQLSKETIQRLWNTTFTPEGHLSVRFSPSHLPKTLRIQNKHITDWETLLRDWLHSSTPVEYVAVQLVCHGIFLQRTRAELLWKIQEVSVFLTEPEHIYQATNIDEYKADIESEWENRLNSAIGHLERDMAQWAARIEKTRLKISEWTDRFQEIQRRPTHDPEWHAGIQYLQRELQRDHENYFI